MIYIGALSVNTAELIGQTIQDAVNNHSEWAAGVNFLVSANGQTVPAATTVIEAGIVYSIFPPAGKMGA